MISSSLNQLYTGCFAPRQRRNVQIAATEMSNDPNSTQQPRFTSRVDLDTPNPTYAEAYSSVVPQSSCWTSLINGQDIMSADRVANLATSMNKIPGRPISALEIRRDFKAEDLALVAKHNQELAGSLARIKPGTAVGAARAIRQRRAKTKNQAAATRVLEAARLLRAVA